jgi:hypothetical protein
VAWMQSLAVSWNSDLHRSKIHTNSSQQEWTSFSNVLSLEPRSRFERC